MKTKHTPREWSRCINLINAGDYCIHSHGKKICEMPSQDEGENEANAKLIVAAPNLLESCIKALQEIKNPKRDGSLAEDILIKAIKRATE